MIRTLLTAGIVSLGLTLSAGAGPNQRSAQNPAQTAAQSSHLTDVSAQKRRAKRPRRAQRPRQTRGRQIACTRFGCQPIPRGCRIVTEYNPWTWNPTGFDAVRC